MFETGLLDEVRHLLDAGLDRGTTARRAIGYAQAVDVLQGRRELPDAIDETIQLTWRYVRRQRSWFARWSDAARLEAGAAGVLPAALAAAGVPSRTVSP
jgi:tRNA dimethylallyltransferase